MGSQGTTLTENAHLEMPRPYQSIMAYSWHILEGTDWWQGGRVRMQRAGAVSVGRTQVSDLSVELVTEIYTGHQSARN